MRRQVAYQKLPIHTWWWSQFEPSFIQGLELRIEGFSFGDLLVLDLVGSSQEKYRTVIEELATRALEAAKEFSDNRNPDEEVR